MTTELWCLLAVTFWGLPVVYAPATGRGLRAGLGWAFGNREVDPPSPAWVGRAERAARNHFENLPLFVVVVLVAHVMDVHDDATRAAAATFVVARVAHTLIYWAGITVVRTLAYYAALIAVGVIASRLV
ncbi:MAG: MAPEG family protein [Deltaproteobacteria bacterium]|nr:MAPEG family protein [Deltaproteobacteria bacterium]